MNFEKTNAIWIFLTALSWALSILLFWLYKKSESKLFENKMLNASLEGELKTSRALHEAESARWSQNKEALREVVQSVAGQALAGNSELFINMAKGVLSEVGEKTNHHLSIKQMEIGNLIKPVVENLERLQSFHQDMEAERQKSYQSIGEQLQRVVEGSHQLRQETRSLKDALKKPHVRGKWGELQLKNCIELAGMSEYADVTFQNGEMSSEEKKLIPDMVVKMPGGRKVFVDAKTPIEAFLASIEAVTAEEKNAEMIRHGRQVMDHIKDLSRKDYGASLKDSPDFTVMFLPNESFLYAALESQPHLVEFALEKKILVSTPPTLVGLLKVIRYGWNEERLAKNAAQISEVGAELHSRISDFVEVYLGIGKEIDDVKKKYDSGLSKLNTRVLVQAKKMELLGAKGKRDLPELDLATKELPADL